MTKEEAIQLASTGWWKDKSAQEVASFQLEEDMLCMPFGDFHAAAEKALGRPIFTHEFGFNRDGLIAELKGLAAAPSLQEIIDQIPDDKTRRRRARQLEEVPMKASEFIAKANAAGYDGCEEGLADFAAELVAVGILEADDPQPQERRRVEVEGVEVEGPDEEGDVSIETPGHMGYVEASKAPAVARALLAWAAGGEGPQKEAQAEFPACNAIGVKVDRIGTRSCAVREDRGSGSAVYLDPRAIAELYAVFCPQVPPQAAPGPAQGTRERPYIWRRKREDGSTEEVPVWLRDCDNGSIFLYAGDPSSGSAIAAIFPQQGTAYLTGYRGKVLFASESDLPQPAAQPEPEAQDGEVLLRLTREEAMQLRAVLSRVNTHLDRVWRLLAKDGTNEWCVDGPSISIRPCR